MAKKSNLSQYAAGILGTQMSTDDNNAPLLVKLQAYTEGYKHLAIYALICGLLLIVVSLLIRKLMAEVK